MADNDPFGFDPEDLDRMFRGAGEQLRGALGQFGRLFDGAGPGWVDNSARRSRPAPEPETTGETGDGVWAIYTLGADGAARAEQVFATELGALRANKDNTDVGRKVRFLPYGIPVSVLDGAPTSSTGAHSSDSTVGSDSMVGSDSTVGSISADTTPGGTDVPGTTQD